LDAVNEGQKLHEPLGAEFLHGIAFVVILGAAGAFAGFGDEEFFDDLGNI
jgi:hypothetical protein